MLRKYLPRFGAGVLAGALVLVAGACSDTTGPRGPLLLLAAAAPAGDSVPQLTVEVRFAFRDSLALRVARLYVDSAAGAAPRQEVYLYNQTRQSAFLVAPGPGRHTITVVAEDSTGRRASASITRVFALPEVAYAATALPDLGGTANAVHVNPAGDVAGWVAAADGAPRPAVWTKGALTVLPLPGGAGAATAQRVNTAGDVLLQVLSPTQRYDGTLGYYPSSPVVRRADGALIPLGPVAFAAIPSSGAIYIPCCQFAANLTERRQALAHSNFGLGSVRGTSAVYDVPSGALADTVRATFTLMNAGGQMVGSTSAQAGIGASHITRGFTAPDFPPYAALLPCYDPHPSATPVSLDDAGNVLLRYGGMCQRFVYLSTGGGAWLERSLGPTTAAQLSPQGGVVAALDSVGAVYVWRAATRRAERVRLTGGAWRVDSLGAVNAAGVIAAHAVDAATGRAAALLLTPATR